MNMNQFNNHHNNLPSHHHEEDLLYSMIEDCQYTHILKTSWWKSWFWGLGDIYHIFMNMNQFNNHHNNLPSHHHEEDLLYSMIEDCQYAHILKTSWWKSWFWWVGDIYHIFMNMNQFNNNHNNLPSHHHEEDLLNSMIEDCQYTHILKTSWWKSWFWGLVISIIYLWIWTSLTIITIIYHPTIMKRICCIRW